MMAKTKKEKRMARKISTIFGIDYNITDTIAATPAIDLITFSGLNTRNDRNTFRLVDGKGVNANTAKKTTTKSSQFQASKKYGFGLLLLSK
jgi:hypothetical protein